MPLVVLRTGMRHSHIKNAATRRRRTSASEALAPGAGRFWLSSHVENVGFRIAGMHACSRGMNRSPATEMFLAASSKISRPRRWAAVGAIPAFRVDTTAMHIR